MGWIPVFGILKITQENYYLYPMYKMPRGRRNAPRRAMIRRRRMARRPRIGRMLSVRQPVHYFKRTAYYSGFLNGSTTADVNTSYIAQLSQVPGYTEFTSLFDCYKIKAIKWRFSPRANSAEVGTNLGLVKMFSAIDYDDNTPVNLTDLLQYESLKTTSTDKDHVRYVKPRIAKQVFQSAPNPAYAPTTGWLDCDYPTVPHYGLKLVLQQLPAGTQSFDIQVTYYLAFKNVV